MMCEKQMLVIIVRLTNAGGEFISEPISLSLNLPSENGPGLSAQTVKVGTDVVLGVNAIEQSRSRINGFLTES